MNFDRSPIFSYLEEDNVQCAYFRVRPLLTLDGDVREEAVSLWPTEGGLRIVPDRNEQHSFKSRMRSLGAYCVVDLRGQPVDAGKIRTNKNFHPERDEVNQYILYSDTVRPLPEHTFYQLTEGKAADFARLAESVVTPCFFIREGDTLYGPVRKASPAAPQPAGEAQGMLYDLPCPDGVTRTILCLEDAAEKPAPAKPSAKSAAKATAQPKSPARSKPAADKSPERTDEALPIGKTLHILDEGKSTDATLHQLDKPVSASANLLRDQPVRPMAEPPRSRASARGGLYGTPLVRAPLHVSPPPSKNRTQEYVNSQWIVGKYEPPVPELPAGAALRSIANPVEDACAMLRTAWNASSAHDQLIDCILSLEGIRIPLEAKLCKGTSMTNLQRVLQEKLQDLEAERLSALYELDRANKDVDAYRQELLSGMTARITQETAALKADQAVAASAVETLKASIAALTLQRDALITRVNELQASVLPETVAKLLADSQMIAPAAGIPLRITPLPGQACAAEVLIPRLMDACRASGLDISKNAATVLLVLLAMCPRIGFISENAASLSTLSANVAAAMGWQHCFAHQTDTEQRPVVGLRPTDGTPALLLTSTGHHAPMPGLTKLTLVPDAARLTGDAAYAASQWPMLPVPTLPFVPVIDTADAIPVSAASLTALLDKEYATDAEVDTVLSPILTAAKPLSGAAKKELYRFVSVCAGLLAGGLPAAADWGILLWIVPALGRDSKTFEAIKPLLDEYPLSLSHL